MMAADGGELVLVIVVVINTFGAIIVIFYGSGMIVPANLCIFITPTEIRATCTKSDLHIILRRKTLYLLSVFVSLNVVNGKLTVPWSGHASVTSAGVIVGIKGLMAVA